MKRPKPQGQSTTEYVFLLLLAFTLFRIVQQGLLPAFDRYSKFWGRELEARFSRSLHRIR